MKTTELRIGNYLEGRSIVKVSAILDEDMVMIEGNPTRFYTHVDLPFTHCLEPIKLTEDFMLKMGFEEAIVGWVIAKGDFDFYIIECQNEFFPTLFKDQELSCEDNQVIGLQKIKYVHQLQNLHYILTGEELTIQL
jgi:hypothetical protein